MQNFLDCVKDRDSADLRRRRSAAGRVIVCHIGAIALRMGPGTKLKWDPAKHQFDNTDANKMLSPPVPRRVQAGGVTPHR